VNNYQSPVLTAAVVVHLVICSLLIAFRDSFDNANAALLFAPSTAGRANAPLHNHDGSVTRGSHELKVGRDGLPSNAEVELVVKHADIVRGRFLLTAAARITRPDLEQRLVAVAFADQVGAALSSDTAAHP
jgi:hypothetical protein